MLQRRRKHFLKEKFWYKKLAVFQSFWEDYEKLNETAMTTTNQ